MKNDFGIEKMQDVWNNMIIQHRSKTNLPKIDFDSLVSSAFSLGPFYFYILDFYDYSISNISERFEEIHGVSPVNAKSITDILQLIHPDDIPFVKKCEEASFEFFSNIGLEKQLQYKTSYNFRFKTANGSYRLFNHQSLVLTMDEKGNFIKSLNIHTNIEHLTKKNNHTVSLIGLNGEPSYFDIPVFSNETAPSHSQLSNRELEIIKLISDGKDTKGIAGALQISSETVKTHRKNILQKTNCRNMAELVARSLSEGWI